jgi:hypothetical protein
LPFGGKNAAMAKRGRDFTLDDRQRRVIAACRDFMSLRDAAPAPENEAPAERLDGMEIFPHDALLPLTAWQRLKATGDLEELKQAGAELAHALPHIARVESALGKLPPFAGACETHCDLPGPVAAHLEPGAILRDTGFLSAATSGAADSGRFRLVIYSHGGGRQPGPYSRDPAKGTVIFRPGTQLRVLEIEDHEAPPVTVIAEEITR